MKNSFCKGSISLGTACLECKRCLSNMINTNKFRAWDPGEEKMIYKKEGLQEYCSSVGGGIVNVLHNILEAKYSNYIYMQYVGRRDVDKKELYEDDIISIPIVRLSRSNWYQKTNKNHGETGDVVYERIVKSKGWEGFSQFKSVAIPITNRQIVEIEKPRGSERETQLVDALNIDWSKIKYVGNAYENPELLK